MLDLDHVWGHHVVLNPRLRDVLGGRKLAVLGHTDGMLVQRGLHEEFAVFHADTRATVDTLIFQALLRSSNRVLRS